MTHSRADILPHKYLPEGDASKSLNRAAWHLPHALPQSNLDTYRAATARKQRPASQTCSRDIRQLRGGMLRPSRVKSCSSLTPPATAKQLWMCQTRIIPRPRHSSSGYSQCSCINIIINLILMSFGFNNSWQSLPCTENSQLLNDS